MNHLIFFLQFHDNHFQSLTCFGLSDPVACRSRWVLESLKEIAKWGSNCNVQHTRKVIGPFPSACYLAELYHSRFYLKFTPQMWFGFLSVFKMLSCIKVLSCQFNESFLFISCRRGFLKYLRKRLTPQDGNTTMAKTLAEKEELGCIIHPDLRHYFINLLIYLLFI